jgi:transketolase
MKTAELKQKALSVRLIALNAIQKSGVLGVGAAMSSVEILVSLYFGDINMKQVLSVSPFKPGWDGQDYFVLGKGEATPVLYAILADKGFFDESELRFFSQVNSFLQARPFFKVPGICISTLSSSHALSQALGIALALKSEKKNNNVFCMIDACDFQNGQIFEAMTVASHHKLNNLIMIVDDSSLQSEGPIRSVVDVGFLQNKIDSFGWQVYRVVDGHDFDEIINAFSKSLNVVRRPVCIWCNTVTGKGISLLEGKEGYFNAPLSENEYNLISQSLK